MGDLGGPGNYHSGWGCRGGVAVVDEAAVFGVVNHGVWVGVRSHTPPFHRGDGEKVLECHLDQDGIAFGTVDPFRV